MDLIKRDDAIKIIERCKHRLEGNGSTYQIMLDMIKDIPSAEENIPTSIKQAYARGYNHAKEEIALSGEYERAYKRGRESVLLQPKQGEWERIPYSMTDYGGRCSLCHFKVGNPTNFCPNCGARMKGTTDGNK